MYAVIKISEVWNNQDFHPSWREFKSLIDDHHGAQGVAGRCLMSVNLIPMKYNT